MFRVLRTVLLAALLPAAAFAQDALTQSQQDEVDARIRAYLLENPELIVEAMEVLEARRTERQGAMDAELVAAYSDELLRDGYSHVFGNPEGDVLIVEFADYRCGYCKRAHPEVKALLESDPNVGLVMKEFPILGRESVTASRAAMAAMRLDPEAYAPLHDAMVEWRGQLDEATVFALVEEAGLDPEAVRAEMGSPEIDTALRETQQLARALGVNGTPGFVIGDRIVRGFVDRATLEALVAEAREG